MPRVPPPIRRGRRSPATFRGAPASYFPMPLAHAFQIPARHRFRRHEHEGVHLCAVLRGSFAERDGRGWTRMDAGAVRISRAARHDIDFGPEGAWCLVVQPDDVELPRLPKPRFLDRDSFLSTLVDRLGAALRDEAATALRVDTLATELIAQVLRRIDGRVSSAPAWLGRVAEMLNDAPAPLPVSAIAGEVGVHRVHLARVFRDHFGLSVSEYAHRLRLDRARQMLMRGREPLAEVAAIAGFSDQSHMTRAVRAAFGTTPGGMRGALHPFKTGSGRRR